MGKHGNREEGMEIIFEDDWLIVVNKPSGLLSVATNKGGNKGPEVTAHSLLMNYMAEQQGGRGGRGRGKRPDMGGQDSQGTPRIFIVHRLDRDTSGLIVFAKDEETKRALMDNWEEAVQERKYIAILEGQIDSAVDMLTLFAADDAGNIDAGTLIGDAVEMFKLSDVREAKVGIFDLTYGAGEVVLSLPRNPVLDIFVGDLGIIKLTADDLLELRNYLT